MTIPYTLEQNGVAKTKNRSIVGAARAMLHDQSLPFFLWAEVVKLVATRKVFMHACVLACRRLKLGNQLYLIYFS